MHKAQLRKLYLQQRRQLTPSLSAQYLTQIVAFFSSINLPTLNYCLLYQAIPRHNEIPLEAFQAAIKRRFPQCIFAYPVTRADFSWQIMIAKENTIFKPGILGILEPQDTEVLQVVKLDLIFVPLLCFDLMGYRVGYGKGIYDQILAHSHPDTLKIGLSYFPPVPKIEDLHSQDLPMDLVITPEKIYYFN